MSSQNSAPGNPNLAQRAEEIRIAERVKEIKDVLGLISNNLAIPLYLVFWICDLIYMPDLKYEFLGLRLAVIPLCFGVRHFAKNITDYFRIQVLCLFFIGTLALYINAMIFLIGTPETPYYAGLNLVAVGTLAFIPWSKRFYLATVFFIFAPYLIYGTYWWLTHGSYISFFISLFFITGTITISFVMRFFNEALMEKDVKSRVALENEINNRDIIIKAKADEAVKLAYLSNQFSPQVVESIKSGKIDLNQGVHRSLICAIFIDIVNSTERVSRIDKDKTHKVITRFMDDVMGVLLKYDITIDKFLGDGILAFSNDPIKYDDFVERALRAAFEIRERIRLSSEYYIRYWMNELSIKVGIAAGYANVGFYGSEKHFRSYTAIGPVINMANRLCSIASPNQIIVDSDVVENCRGLTDFHFTSMGPQKIKGFESDLITIYEATSTGTINFVAKDIPECPTCKVILHLANDEKGHFVFKCRSCGYIEKEDSTRQRNVA